MTPAAPSARSGVEPFRVMQVVATAAAIEAAGGEVLHLEVGQPGTGAPAAAVARAQQLLASGAALGYTPAVGIAPLRERIARLYDDRYGLDVDPARVVVTSGASGAVVLIALAAFDPGARVAVAEPGYPCYRSTMTALGLDVVGVRVGPDDGFLLGPDDLDAVVAGSGHLDGVIVASPANPTGTMYDPPRLAALVDWCAAHGTRLIADEIYHGITFGGPAPTALDPPGTGAARDDVCVIGSFSKYYSMTGWRLGWTVLPEPLVDAVDRLGQHLYLSPPTLAQHAALAAMDCTDELDAHVARYAANRDVLRPALADIGVTRLAPFDGAFYLYGDVSHWGVDSEELVARWLRDVGVAAAPGVDFDPDDGHRWVRWSLAGDTATVVEAAERLRAWDADHREAGRAHR